MAKNLLIVESPAKAKTINKYLGKDFQVLASYGHVRDLVPKEGAVDTDHGFAMNYELIEKNEKHVDAIAKARQGRRLRSISRPTWTAKARRSPGTSPRSCKQRGLLEGKRACTAWCSPRSRRARSRKRSRSPRKLSMDLVNAQQARRALDYLVGFNLSPVLWRKVQRGLSAGRVQSPALRMIVEREEEIEAFKRARILVDRSRLRASGRSRSRRALLQARRQEVRAVRPHQRSATRRPRASALRSAAQGALRVSDVAVEGTQAPPVAAVHHLDAAAGSRAQARLHHQPHDAGRAEPVRRRGDRRRRHGRPDHLHAYRLGAPVGAMRSANCATSSRATSAPRALPEHAERLPAPSPRTRRKRTRRSARPRRCARRRRSRAYLNDDQRKLYELIWKRAVACQMQPATLNTVSVDLAAGSEHGVPRQRHHRGRSGLPRGLRGRHATRRTPRTRTKAASCRR